MAIIGELVMTERRPSIYDFDVINEHMKKIQQEREEMEKQSDSLTEATVPSPDHPDPNGGYIYGSNANYWKPEEGYYEINGLWFPIVDRLHSIVREYP